MRPREARDSFFTICVSPSLDASWMTLQRGIAIGGILREKRALNVNLQIKYQFTWLDNLPSAHRYVQSPNGLDSGCSDRQVDKPKK
jgi:hypothetical protein